VRFATCFGQLVRLQVIQLCVDYVGGNYQHKIFDKETIIFIYKIVLISKSNKKGYVIELRTVAGLPTKDLFL